MKVSSAACPLIALLFAVTVVPAENQGQAPGSDFLNAIRNDNLGSVRTYIQAGADPNERDETGSTALMYASAYSSSPEMLRVLLDAGAQVNAASDSGATALMWAAGDTPKVLLLLDRRAAVATKNKFGTTALLTAARQDNVAAMRLLIARGADPKASDGGSLLSLALYQQDPEMVKLAGSFGMTLASNRFPYALFGNLTSPNTIQQLLRLGANPNEVVPMVTTSFSTLGLAAFEGEFATVHALVEHGADPNVGGRRGITALMMAAAAARPNPAIVRDLLAKGADIQARDDVGRTALDWALTQGETDVARVLRSAGARATVPPPPTPVPATAPRSTEEAVQQAVARLQPIGPSFYERTGCISCHNQSLPAIAVKLASTKGIAVDPVLAAHPTKATTAAWSVFRNEFLLGRCSLPGFLPNVAYGLLDFDEEGVPPNRVTDAVVLCLAADQRLDGSWRMDDVRPPLVDSGSIVPTALAIRALSTFAPPGRREEMQGRRARALAYLRDAKAADTQDQVFKLLGLVWGDGSTPEVALAQQHLLALQRENGGWGQWPTMEPDAYATGQALYALHAAGVLPTDVAYKNGASHLLRTQLEDGTWFVRSRAFGFQAYFDAGFPHSTHQFISAAATAWATIALAYTL